MRPQIDLESPLLARTLEIAPQDSRMDAPMTSSLALPLLTQLDLYDKRDSNSQSFFYGMIDIVLMH